MSKRKLPRVEQADGQQMGKARGYHQYLKNLKHRKIRKYVKLCLRFKEDPINTDKKYDGYEM
jgi:hypothetical protein